MSQQLTPATPTTEKAERNAAAAAAKDPAMFQRTPFGRRRVPSFIGKLIGYVLLVGVPVVFLYRSASRANRPR